MTHRSFTRVCSADEDLLSLIQNQVGFFLTSCSFNTGTVAFGLDGPSAAAEQVKDQHYHRSNKQQVNQTTADTPEHPQQPQNQQNNKDRPKHSSPPGEHVLRVEGADGATDSGSISNATLVRDVFPCSIGHSRKIIGAIR